jgi:peptide/nickel transport system permease protein
LAGFFLFVILFICVFLRNMFKYILKRILIFIPTLLVISLLTFLLSVSVPGDPVEQMLSSASENGGKNVLASEQAYIDKRKNLGLDLPVFYFSLSNKATPKNLHEIPKKLHRENLEVFINKYGNWNEINSYYQSVKQLEIAVSHIDKDSSNADALIAVKDNLYKLYINHDDATLTSAKKNIQKNIQIASLQSINTPFQNTVAAYTAMKTKATTWKNSVPAIHWYGTQNQYHQWFTKFFKGDFGMSYQDQRPVKTVIWDALRWTLMLSLISMFITYLISIPLGVYTGAHKGSRFDKTTTTILFLLFSLPSFWVATLLIMFFGGGDFLGWFPAYGVGTDAIDDSMNIFQVAGVRMYYLFLPLVCFIYPSLAFISRQMRGAMINTLSQDYIRTARAKGLDEKTVLWKHAIKNSLLPIITLFASIFPLAISGAVTLEIIFSIPGMGKTVVEAIFSRNYPIVYTVVMFSAILTLVGNLVADILYALVDPRISFSKK